MRGEFDVGREDDVPGLVYVFDDGLVEVRPSRTVSVLVSLSERWISRRLAERSRDNSYNKIAALGDEATSADLVAALPRARRIPTSDIAKAELSAPGKTFNKFYCKLVVHAGAGKHTFWVAEATRQSVIKLLQPLLGTRLQINSR